MLTGRKNMTEGTDRDCPPRANLLGVKVSAINMGQALRTIQGWIEHQKPNYVCVTSAHGLLECQDSPYLKRVFNGSGMATPDGMGVVWALKLNGERQVDRVYGPDLMLAVCEQSLRHGWRHYFYGGAPGVAEELARCLGDRFPGLEVAGTYCPPFRPLTPEEDREVIQDINSSGADIVWVGISTPKQERWMADHIGQVDAPVLVGVGAAFDFLSGKKKQAPRWIQRSGLEWLFRLLQEPSRLWQRYIQLPVFVVLVLAQVLGLKQFSVD